MFMDKIEFKNIVPLTKAKVRNGKPGFFWLVMIIAFILTNLIPTLFNIFKKTDSVSNYSTIDFSGLFLFAFAVIFIILNIMYRQMNDYLSVYPQTNNTRFISTQLSQYFVIVIVAVFCLVMYLVEYGLFKILSFSFDNIVLALNFNIGFVIVGLFTFLMYMFLLISVFSLIGVILRKFGYFTILVFIGLISFLWINLKWSIKYVPSIWRFLTREPNIAMFFLKSILVWLAITIIALLLNKYTIYYKSKNKLSNKILLGSISVILVVLVLTTFLKLSVDVSDKPMQVVTTQEVQTGSPYASGRYNEIVIDVSTLPVGSKIKVVCNGIISSQTGNYSFHSNDIYYTGQETINIDKDKLYIYYCFSLNVLNGYNLTDYTNPKLTAELKGDTLYLDYSYTKNLKVVFLPIWSMVSQFDCYKDKNIVKKLLLYSSSSGTGNIFTSSDEMTFE